MSKQIAIQNEKAIVAGISKAFSKMESAKKGYVHSVIELGERLNEAKSKVPYGEWERFLKVNSELTFGHEQATKFMKIANNKLLVLEYFNNENSVNNLTKAISDASPEQLEKVEQLKREAEQKAANDQAEEDRKAFVAAANKKQPEIIEGEFTEVKKITDDGSITVTATYKDVDSSAEKPEEINIETRPDEDPFSVMQEVIDGLQKDNAALVEEIDSVAKIFESNDQLVTAHAEVKKLQELNRVLKESLNGSMNSENAAKRQAKMWKAKYERLAKEVGRE